MTTSRRRSRRKTEASPARASARVGGFRPLAQRPIRTAIHVSAKTADRIAGGKRARERGIELFVELPRMRVARAAWRAFRLGSFGADLFRTHRISLRVRL